MAQNNYASVSTRLLRQFDRWMKHSQDILVSEFGDEKSKIIMSDARKEYLLIIPQIPFIGKYNPFILFLFPTSRCLALYRSVLKHGGTLKQTGDLIYKMCEAELNAIPLFIRKLITFFWFSPWFKHRLRRRAAISQRRKYPDSFVIHFVESDAKSFDYGIDYTECANVKFLKNQHAEELAPYICQTDKIASKLLDWGLIRNTVIANGGDKCDFRFKKGCFTRIESLHIKQY